MLTPPVVTVCLPEGTPVDRLATAAAAKFLAAYPTTLLLASCDPVAHFATSTRFRRGRLLQPQHRVAAGGPVQLLDLDAMRVAARDTFGYRWQVWHRVVAGTKPAQPYWMFLDRHRANPDKYSRTRARNDYLAQPRLAAMATYNALPNRVLDLPTSHLEAFQAGVHAYAHLGLLARIPGGVMVTVQSKYLAPDTDRLADEVSYLDAAAKALAELKPRDLLVALTINPAK